MSEWHIICNQLLIIDRSWFIQQRVNFNHQTEPAYLTLTSRTQQQPSTLHNTTNPTPITDSINPNPFLQQIPLMPTPPPHQQPYQQYYRQLLTDTSIPSAFQTHYSDYGQQLNSQYGSNSKQFFPLCKEHEIPPFFKSNLVSSNRIIKHVNGEYCVYRAFYFQLFKLMFQIQNQQKDYLDIFKQIIFDPNIIHRNGQNSRAKKQAKRAQENSRVKRQQSTNSQYNNYNDRGNKSEVSQMSEQQAFRVEFQRHQKCIAQFTQKVIQNPHGYSSFQHYLPLYPQIDQSTILILQTFIQNANSNQSEEMDSIQSILEYLCEIFQIQLVVFENCFKFEESDVFLYIEQKEEQEDGQGGEVWVYIAYNQIEEEDQEEEDGDGEVQKEEDQLEDQQEEGQQYEGQQGQGVRSQLSPDNSRQQSTINPHNNNSKNTNNSNNNSNNNPSQYEYSNQHPPILPSQPQPNPSIYPPSSLHSQHPRPPTLSSHSHKSHHSSSHPHSIPDRESSSYKDFVMTSEMKYQQQSSGKKPFMGMMGENQGNAINYGEDGENIGIHGINGNSEHNRPNRVSSQMGVGRNSNNNNNAKGQGQNHNNNGGSGNNDMPSSYLTRSNQLCKQQQTNKNPASISQLPNETSTKYKQWNHNPNNTTQQLFNNTNSHPTKPSLIHHPHTTTKEQRGFQKKVSYFDEDQVIEENVSSLVPSQQSLARLESVTEEYRGEYREERYGGSRGGAGSNDRGSNINSMNSMNSMSSNISNPIKSDHILAKQHPYNNSQPYIPQGSLDAIDNSFVKNPISESRRITDSKSDTIINMFGDMLTSTANIQSIDFGFGSVRNFQPEQDHHSNDHNVHDSGDVASSKRSPFKKYTQAYGTSNHLFGISEDVANSSINVNVINMKKAKSDHQIVFQAKPNHQKEEMMEMQLDRQKEQGEIGDAMFRGIRIGQIKQEVVGNNVIGNIKSDRASDNGRSNYSHHSHKSHNSHHSSSRGNNNMNETLMDSQELRHNNNNNNNNEVVDHYNNLTSNTSNSNNLNTYFDNIQARSIAEGQSSIRRSQQQASRRSQQQAIRRSSQVTGVRPHSNSYNYTTNSNNNNSNNRSPNNNYPNPNFTTTNAPPSRPASSSNNSSHNHSQPNSPSQQNNIQIKVNSIRSNSQTSSKEMDKRNNYYDEQMVREEEVGKYDLNNNNNNNNNKYYNYAYQYQSRSQQLIHQPNPISSTQPHSYQPTSTTTNNNYSNFISRAYTSITQPSRNTNTNTNTNNINNPSSVSSSSSHNKQQKQQHPSDQQPQQEQDFFFHPNHQKNTKNRSLLKAGLRTIDQVRASKETNKDSLKAMDAMDHQGSKVSSQGFSGSNRVVEERQKERMRKYQMVNSISVLASSTISTSKYQPYQSPPSFPASHPTKTPSSTAQAFFHPKTYTTKPPKHQQPKQLNDDSSINNGTFYKQFTNSKVMKLLKQPYRTKVQILRNRFKGEHRVAVNGIGRNDGV